MANKDETTEDFAKRMTQVVSNGHTCVAMTLGEKTGLWKIMAGLKEPKTCQEIAKISGMKEKYLKQWLGAVTVGGIVEVDPTGEKYFLPPHRHPALLQGVPPSDNFAGHAWGIEMEFGSLKTVMKAMKDKPSEAPTESKAGPGDDQSAKPDAEADDVCDEMQWFHCHTNDMQESHLFQHILPANPKLMEDLEKGARFLEVGCGTGVSSTSLAEKYPKSTILGFDMSEDFLKQGKERADEKNVPNVSFEIQNANELPRDWSGNFDHALAMNVIQHTTPAKSLSEVHRALGPNGTLTLVTFNSHANVHDNVPLAHTSFIYVGNLCFMDDECSSETEGTNEGQTKQDEGEKEVVEPGWLWGRENIITAVKEAGFKSCEIREIPGTLYEIIYVCSK